MSRGRFGLWAALGVALLSSGCAEEMPVAMPRPRVVTPDEMLRVNGTHLSDGWGREVTLRGVVFDNDVETGRTPPLADHDERDYAKLRELGMNSVRFELTHLGFDDAGPAQSYAGPGWKWLEDNVAWAKANSIYLVLSLRVPPGGEQEHGAGRALWQEETQKARFIELWQAIAARYALEPTIAGYDLLAAPSPRQNREQWRELVERTLVVLRDVDPFHAVFVEAVHAVRGDRQKDASRNFVRLDDPNVVYQFSFYAPEHFTQQGSAWYPERAAEARYPDASVVDLDGERLEHVRTAPSAAVPPGDSPWTEYVTEATLIDDPRLGVAEPVLRCDANAGLVAFDDLKLEVQGAEGGAWRVVFSENLDSLRGFYFWAAQNRGRPGVTAGRAGSGAVTIGGTLTEALLGADALRFVPESGQRYRLRAFAQGKGVSAAARCRVELEFSALDEAPPSRGREAVRQRLDAYAAWGEREQVPIYLGEFGVTRAAFEQGRGGLAWVGDVLDWALEHHLGFAYRAYHDADFGMYWGAGPTDPRTENTELLQLFTDKLGE